MEIIGVHEVPRFEGPNEFLVIITGLGHVSLSTAFKKRLTVVDLDMRVSLAEGPWVRNQPPPKFLFYELGQNWRNIWKTLKNTPNIPDFYVEITTKLPHSANLGYFSHRF